MTKCQCIITSFDKGKTATAVSLKRTKFKIRVKNSINEEFYQMSPAYSRPVILCFLSFTLSASNNLNDNSNKEEFVSYKTNNNLGLCNHSPNKKNPKIGQFQIGLKKKVKNNNNRTGKEKNAPTFKFAENWSLSSKQNFEC